MKEQYSVRCREKNHWRYREGGISRWMNAFQKAIFKSVQETKTFTPFSEEEKRLLLSFSISYGRHSSVCRPAPTHEKASKKANNNSPPLSIFPSLRKTNGAKRPAGSRPRRGI